MIEWIIVFKILALIICLSFGTSLVLFGIKILRMSPQEYKAFCEEVERER